MIYAYHAFIFGVLAYAVFEKGFSGWWFFMGLLFLMERRRTQKDEEETK